MLATAYRDAPIGGPEIRTMLHQMTAQTLTVRDIILIDDRGRQVNEGSSNFNETADFTERDFFVAHQDAASSELFISRPERDPLTHDWSVYASRRLDLADGFHGVIAAEIPIRDLWPVLLLGRHRAGLSHRAAERHGNAGHQRAL